MKQKKEKKKEIRDKKKLIIDKIKNNRDIRTLFEQQQEKDYYKPKRVSNFWNSSEKVSVIKTETYH